MKEPKREEDGIKREGGEQKKEHTTGFLLVYGPAGSSTYWITSIRGTRSKTTSVFEVGSPSMTPFYFVIV